MSLTGPALLHITGTTRLYLVVGDPIRQIRSTELFNRLAAEGGHDAVFVPLQLPSEQLKAAVPVLRSCPNLAGIIATIPHKPALLNLVDQASEQARLVGAVNAIRRDSDGRWIGEIFDGEGYLNGLLDCGVEPAGKSALVVGTGGAGCAVAVSLARRGVNRLCLVDTDDDKVESLVRRLRSAFPSLDIRRGSSDPSGFDIVTNATPLGMRATDPLPLDADKLTAGQVVADMIMAPPVTPLLSQARATCCTVVEGHKALLGQAMAISRFFGMEPARS
ncbi:shikimate dehydrogenase [Marinobacterium nitratireducens]|uniref:Shikimate dehydrogenase n=1 Tax=Marinobacterium nitratireducens TaxID=518897 RepID=A0A918DUL0_9GAMM|nr:shikimate dehydrogenase [Marinobacterium nitratireducens]GGO83868.1 shikimate dehydrogenase [Marinobacterium nitratireducens]